MRSILFVCTANICRSPMAEGVFRKLVEAVPGKKSFDIDSAGTHDYHIGKPPFPPAVASAKRRGYDITHLVSRRIRAHDFDHFDHILAMDRSNLASLRQIAPTRCKHKIELLLEYGDKFHGKEVPDPYGGEVKDFELALDMIEDGCRGLAQLLLRTA
ncbi:MAG: low molecular weight protein-tyrosine-phosphatase [Usitatibacter sp.]